MNPKSVLFDDLISGPYDQNSASLVSSSIHSATPSENLITISLDQTQSSSSTIEPSTDKGTSTFFTTDGVIGCEELEKNRPPPFRSSDYKLVSNIFIGSMMAQYILIFFAIPFSEVDNRPAATVLSCLFGYLSVCFFICEIENTVMFLLCVLMIPAGLINLPTHLSLQSSLISCVLKCIDLAANIYSVILCLRVKEPMIEYTFDSDRFPVSPLDITVYIQIVSCLLLVSSIISLFFATVIFVFNLAYFQAKKMYDTKTNHDNILTNTATV